MNLGGWSWLQHMGALERASSYKRGSTHLGLYCAQILRNRGLYIARIGARTSGMASSSRIVIFLSVETQSGAFSGK